MPLPLTVSCFSKIQIGSFLVPAHLGSPRIRAVKMRVCVHISIHKIPIHDTAVPMAWSSASKLYYTSWSSVSLPQTYVIMLIAHEWISTSWVEWDTRWRELVVTAAERKCTEHSSQLPTMLWGVGATSLARRLTHCFILLTTQAMPSVLWRCWLGGRKGIWPVKNWGVGCWCIVLYNCEADLHDIKSCSTIN